MHGEGIYKCMYRVVQKNSCLEGQAADSLPFCQLRKILMTFTKLSSILFTVHCTYIVLVRISLRKASAVAKKAHAKFCSSLQDKNAYTDDAPVLSKQPFLFIGRMDSGYAIVSPKSSCPWKCPYLHYKHQWNLYPCNLVLSSRPFAEYIVHWKPDIKLQFVPVEIYFICGLT